MRSLYWKGSDVFIFCVFILHGRCGYCACLTKNWLELNYKRLQPKGDLGCIFVLLTWKPGWTTRFILNHSVNLLQVPLGLYMKHSFRSQVPHGPHVFHWCLDHLNNSCCIWHPVQTTRLDHILNLHSTRHQNQQKHFAVYVYLDLGDQTLQRIYNTSKSSFKAQMIFIHQINMTIN